MNEQPPTQSSPPPASSNLIPYTLVALIIGQFFIIALLISQMNNDDPAQPVAEGVDDPAPVVVEQEDSGDEPVTVVTVEVTRLATVIVTPTFTPLPPTPTPLAPEDTTDDDAFMGGIDAPVKVVEFSDYQCGYCARFYGTTLRPLNERYGDLIQFVYRDYPIFGEPSFQAAMAAECAGDQGKFWDYHNIIFNNHLAETQLPLVIETFFQWSTELDLDMETWQACMDGTAVVEEISLDAQTGQLWGITGTPTFFVNGRKLVGAHPLETFIQLIDEELLAQGIEPPTGESGG